MASHAFAANPNAPKDGVYSTSNGTVLGGHASEAWCTGVGPGRVGNMESAMSWDGANLGTQWKVWGMAIDAAGPVRLRRPSRLILPLRNFSLNFAVSPI
ncbi:MAG: hypothetical protein NTW97_00880 [Candidatus Krumholzibacteria bacterium]|nr:hypothetical protein [Candidatus Krumholzibacteria bacterium]